MITHNQFSQRYTLTIQQTSKLKLIVDKIDFSRKIITHVDKSID